MTPWWPWEYVQLPRPPSMGKCRLWLIVSWYPPSKWLSHLDKTVTVVVLQMLRYVRNIILITKQQLVVFVSHLPWAGSAKGIYLFIYLCLCSIRTANHNVPQEGRLFGEFCIEAQLRLMSLCAAAWSRSNLCYSSGMQRDSLGGGGRGQRKRCHAGMRVKSSVLGKTNHQKSLQGCLLDSTTMFLPSQHSDLAQQWAEAQ